MGLPPGLDTVHVAQALGEGRGSQAGLVVAIMQTKGTGRIDSYEVRRRGGTGPASTSMLNLSRARCEQGQKSRRINARCCQLCRRPYGGCISSSP